LKTHAVNTTVYRQRYLTLPARADTVALVLATARIDVLLSTLNATDVGTLESVAAKLRQVQEELTALDQPALAARAGEAIAALERADVVEFKRARAFLQSKIGHLRR
jgi:CTP:molybdopterin cytidylyltransferase MocA